MYVPPKLIPPICFHGNYNQCRAQYHYVIEQILSYTICFNIVTSITYTLLPAMKKSLHVTPVKICTSGSDPLFHSCCYSVFARQTLPVRNNSLHAAFINICTSGGDTLSPLLKLTTTASLCSTSTVWSP